MNHDDALELVHAMHDRPLDDHRRSELDAHLADCERCRGVSETYALVFDALREEHDHLAIDEIVSYATARDGLSATELERVERHVKTCESCTDDLARVERVHAAVEADPVSADGDTPRRPSWWSTPSSWLALAAGLTALALIYPAYLGIVGWPEAASRASAIEAEHGRLEARLGELSASADRAGEELERLRGWSGTADLEVITSALRGTESAPTIEVDPSRPFVLLGVQVAVTNAVPDDAPLRFELVRADGELTAEMTTVAERARSQVRSTGVVTWIVPSSDLSEGDYRLRVARDDVADDPVLLEVSVRVRATGS